MSYTTKKINGKTYIRNKYTVSIHLSSAIINGDYSVFDYYNEESKSFDDFLDSISNDMKELAIEKNCEVDSIIYDIDAEEEGFFDTCEFYKLKSNCTTLKVLAICK